MTVPVETLDQVLEAGERIYAAQSDIIETIIREGRDPTVAELREFNRLTHEFLSLGAAVGKRPETLQ